MVFSPSPFTTAWKPIFNVPFGSPEGWDPPATRKRGNWDRLCPIHLIILGNDFTSLDVNENPDQLLIKAEFSDFLQQTRFDQMYPDVDLMVSAPGCYTIISQQIEAIHFAREFNANHEIPYDEAVKYWYDTVYYPIVETIREQNILEAYEGRTETGSLPPWWLIRSWYLYCFIYPVSPLLQS